MIPLPIRLLAIAASAAYMVSILLTLRSSRMTVRQSLLWVASGIAFLFFSAFPYPLIYLAQWLGFAAPSNAGFIGWSLALTGLLFYQSLTTSQQEDQLRTLCQEVALLRARLDQHQESDR